MADNLWTKFVALAANLIIINTDMRHMIKRSSRKVWIKPLMVPKLKVGGKLSCGERLLIKITIKTDIEIQRRRLQ